MISGGYYIKSRKIQESEIAIAPPHVREIWDWLLREANHNEGKSGGVIIKRGQTMRSYKDIQDGLHWRVGFRKESYTKWQCEIAMKWLTKRHMITTMKTTRGMIITINNYDYYQNPKNYESHNESHNKTTTEPQSADTINKKKKEEEEEKEEIYNKPKTWKNDFEIYKKDLRAGIVDLYNDKDWIKQQEKLNPGVDVKLSIEKACVNFWVTEAGWKHKKGKKTKDIDWKQTMASAISMKTNKVYKK